MTINDAISELAHYIHSDCLTEAPSNDACRMAIKALKEQEKRNQLFTSEEKQLQNDIGKDGICDTDNQLVIKLIKDLCDWG